MDLKISDEYKQEMVEKIQTYFERERDESIGGLAAELMLDFFLKEVGAIIYNQGVADARTVLQERMAEFDDALYSLERPVRRTQQ